MRDTSESREDLRLLRQTASGDRAAFTAFVRRHQGSVFRFARSLSADESGAEEVMQETFLAAFRYAASYQADGHVRGWLFRIARNAAFRLHRRNPFEVTEHQALDDLGEEAGWGDEESSPEAMAALAERRELLERALLALPESDRAVLVLRDLEELSAADSAEILGLTVPALKSKLHRARLGLMAELRTLRDTPGAA